jgi:hypothetical protein
MPHPLKVSAHIVPPGASRFCTSQSSERGGTHENLHEMRLVFFRTPGPWLVALSEYVILDTCLIRPDTVAAPAWSALE